ncbi:MAG: hypothetical protein OEV81_00040 [Betaproteobacteria bacterium]|nr:hypothetical protein [Betaproteobacteria bacterium]
MRRRQRGLGWLGSLVVLALAVGAGYYLYKEMVIGDDTPSCAVQQNECLQICRRTSADSATAQACQEACRREADVCAARR